MKRTGDQLIFSPTDLCSFVDTKLAKKPKPYYLAQLCCYADMVEQFLNVIETVLSGSKRAIIHRSDYESKGKMTTAISRYFRERNQHFNENPQCAGKTLWGVDSVTDTDYENTRLGSYREW